MAGPVPARAGNGVLPLSVEPMLAQAAEGPLASSSHAYEVKWDGMRVLAGLDGDRVSLLTRNRLEAFPRFPELACLRGAVRPARAILDGEIVRLVEGRPNFGSLQTRIQSQNPREIRRLAEAEPAALILFDALRVEDEWLLALPWEERRRRLEACLQPTEAVQFSPVWEDGAALWKTVCAMDLEGVMAKRLDSPYTPGRRTPGWLKIKRLQSVEMVVGGWTEGTGNRSAALGALVLGRRLEGRLLYLGRVGSGFDQEGLETALRLLRPLETQECPFAAVPDTDTRAHWVRPELVCEVRHQGWSADAKLRFPVFLRWRPDRSPGELDAG